MKYFLKIFFSFLLVFSLILSGGLYFYLNYDDRQKKEEVKLVQLDETINKERVNILLLGIDSLDGEKQSSSEPIRTDTMMILSMDPIKKNAFILSIPRDSRVAIDGRAKKEKINHAYAYGGVELSIKTVKDTLQVPIHHYFLVDYNALYKTVDDLGGIEIDVPMDMYYQDLWAKPPLTIDLKKGNQILDSDKAIQFLRFRKGYFDQDLGRIQAQQQFLDALVRKALSPASITKIPKYIETMYMYVKTDMSKKDILNLAKDGIKINPDNIIKQTIKGEPKDLEASYFIIDEEGMKAQLDYLLASNYDDETKDSIDEEASNKDISINVYNGSGYQGVAQRASDLLKIQNIVVNSTGNASNFENEETIIYYKSDRELAKNIMEVLEVGRIVEGTKVADYEEPEIAIILGKDFES